MRAAIGRARKGSKQSNKARAISMWARGITTNEGKAGPDRCRGNNPVESQNDYVVTKEWRREYRGSDWIGGMVAGS